MEHILAVLTTLADGSAKVGAHNPDWKRELYRPPSKEDLDMLSFELYFVQGVYVLTFCYAFYNIVAYVTLQGRFRNWLISLFYFLSVIVLVARSTEFIYIQKMYDCIQDDWEYFDEKDWKDLVDIDRLVESIQYLGIFFLLADYSKFALGYI